MSYSSHFSCLPLHTPLCKGLWDFLFTFFSVKGCKNVHVLDYRNVPTQHSIYASVGTFLQTHLDHNLLYFLYTLFSLYAFEYLPIDASFYAYRCLSSPSIFTPSRNVHTKMFLYISLRMLPLTQPSLCMLVIMPLYSLLCTVQQACLCTPFSTLPCKNA